MILVEVGLDCTGASVWLMLASSPGQTVGPRLVVMVTILFVVVIVGHGCVGVVAVVHVVGMVTRSVVGVALAQ